MTRAKCCFFKATTKFYEMKEYLRGHCVEAGNCSERANFREEHLETSGLNEKAVMNNSTARLQISKSSSSLGLRYNGTLFFHADQRGFLHERGGIVVIEKNSKMMIPSRYWDPVILCPKTRRLNQHKQAKQKHRKQRCTFRKGNLFGEEYGAPSFANDYFL